MSSPLGHALVIFYRRRSLATLDATLDVNSPWPTGTLPGLR